MKTAKTKSQNKKTIPNDYTLKPSLQGKYNDQPLFQDKMDRANIILEKFGIPKFNHAR